MGLGAPYESLAACKHRFKRESKSVPELNLTNLRTQLRYSEIAAGYLTSVSRIRQRLYVEVWLLTAPAPPVLPLPSIKLLLQCPFKFPLATKPLPDPLRESRRWSQQSHAPNFHPQITSANRNPRMNKLPMISVLSHQRSRRKLKSRIEIGLTPDDEEEVIELEKQECCYVVSFLCTSGTLYGYELLSVLLLARLVMAENSGAQHEPLGRLFNDGRCSLLWRGRALQSSSIVLDAFPATSIQEA
ncbi:hypothetical protein JHW43_001864 [Diplocarpon mali]|nr:hypothetical protein JHW43_001864 [Diplocarpon mali]